MDTYVGDVEPGKPAQTRRLAHLTITKVAVGDFNNNAYLLECNATGARLLIDAAAEPDTLLALIGEAPLDGVLTTHQHGDHWQALGDVVAATGATTYAGEFDAEGIPVPTDVLVKDGDKVHVGNIVLEAVHLVGHTPGSIALIYRDPDGAPHLFTGDCLFPGGVGNTWGDAEAFDNLFRDVTTKLFDRLPDETWFYPGHGKDGVLGLERPQLAEWRARGW